MTQQDICAGTIVKDKEEKVNYGLPVKIIQSNNSEVMVAFTNLDGRYQESWMAKEQVLVVDEIVAKSFQPVIC